jgi:hypothetical protein
MVWGDPVIFLQRTLIPLLVQNKVIASTALGRMLADVVPQLVLG